jgi:hypothetical protein
MAPPKRITADTVIQIDLKTLVIVLVFIISTIGGAYWRLSSTIDTGLSGVHQEVTGISNQVMLVDGKVQGLVLTLQGKENQSTNKSVQNQSVQNQSPR